MKTSLLTIDEVLKGYDVVSQLYPHVPPMSFWRAWEYAAYQRYQLVEPVLDVGCGDGHFFKLLWPNVVDVTGIDHDFDTVELARQSGVYSKVLLDKASDIKIENGQFNSVFANCALEHMDDLDKILQNIFMSLKSGGEFIFSVVTDKFISWNSVAELFNIYEFSDFADNVIIEHKKYHHLVNALCPEEWKSIFERNGFELIEHTPIVPMICGKFFLFIDSLWHKKSQGIEIGNSLFDFFQKVPNFVSRFRDFFEGLLKMEYDWKDCCGAVFYMRRK